MSSELGKDRELVRSVWPEWELLELLGYGQFGVVYKARKKGFAGYSYAAVKIVTIEHQTKENGFSPEQTDSYLASVAQNYAREIQMMECVKGYSNIVNIDDYTVVKNSGGKPWYVLIRMELLSPLYAYLEEHEPAEEDIIRIGSDLCRALEICKARKIVHRDIKPANVFVNSDGVFKLGDFGVARQIMDYTFQTKTGTPDYMAPEVYNGALNAADFERAHRADIYSVGMLLYWIANGRCLPFIRKDGLITADEISEAFQKRMSGEPLPPPAKVSPFLQEVILKACSFDSAQRYQTAEEFREALEKKNEPQGQEAEPPAPKEEAPRSKWKILCLVLLLAAAVAAAVIWLSGKGKTTDPADTTKTEQDPVETMPSSESEGDLLSEGDWTEWSADRRESSDPDVLEEQSRTVYSWWAAQCTKCGHNNPWHGKTETCRHCGSSLANDQGLWKSVFQYTPEKGETEKIFGRDNGRYFDSEPYWVDEKPVIQYRYRLNASKAPSPTPEPTEEPEDSGSCGEKLRWQISGTELRISGTGGMYDYSTENRPPWNEYGSRIERVVVEEGATKIGKYAFFRLENLAEVELPGSLRRINTMAFGYCSQLSSLNLPEGVEHIEKSIVYRCPQLKSIRLPGSIQLIEGSFAGECENLAEITLGDGCKDYVLQDGVLFDASMEELICHPAGLEDLSYTIPEKVRTVGVYAFAENGNLTEVILPDGLVTIDSCAFSGCRNLKSVTIPDSVATLGIYAFYGCEKLREVRLPNRITWLEQQAFYGCSSLREIVIPSGVTRIGTYVFGNCSALEKIVIPDSVTSITVGAFEGSPNVVIYCGSGSYAEQFAIENSIPFSSAVVPIFNVSGEELLYKANKIIDDSQTWNEDTAPQSLYDFPLLPSGLFTFPSGKVQYENTNYNISFNQSWDLPYSKGYLYCHNSSFDLIGNSENRIQWTTNNAESDIPECGQWIANYDLEKEEFNDQTLYPYVTYYENVGWAGGYVSASKEIEIRPVEGIVLSYHTYEDGSPMAISIVSFVDEIKTVFLYYSPVDGHLLSIDTNE